ncbi:GcrA family cell cycle regulator [Pseudoroseomonas globiformis]|uniref:GcrA family cell cycle regulator n=1 Tax=Teichococcus globiformis TaxID=2307229 RepID=A0ABV7FYL9_9PROT
MDWTTEAIDALKALWAEGHSTAEIGRRMGISKNAVVGKAHRLSLPARPSPIRRETGTSPAAASRPVQEPKPAVIPATRPSTPLPVATLPPATRPIAPPAALAQPRPAAPPPPRRPAPVPSAVVRPFQRLGGRSCCWPIGEPGTPEFRFCTAEAINGKPYCPEHASIAYVKARDRREDAA